MVEIDAFKTMLTFSYNAYKNVILTSKSALAVLYIGIWITSIFVVFISHKLESTDG